MTREEAIERLKQNKAAAEFYAGMVKNTNTIENELKDMEAMNMAIEALQQVTGKLRNPDDSLLTEDAEDPKEQKSKLDLIRRQDAIDAIDKRIAQLLENPVFRRKHADIDLYGVKELIREIPSADRPTGKWWIREYEYFTCSECGDDYWNGCDCTEEAEERLRNGDHPNFCPNCGADMRGEE